MHLSSADFYEGCPRVCPMMSTIQGDSRYHVPCNVPSLHESGYERTPLQHRLLGVLDQAADLAQG